MHGPILNLLFPNANEGKIVMSVKAEDAEDILKAILKYLNSLSLEQLNGEVKVSFYLHETGDSKVIQINIKH